MCGITGFITRDTDILRRAGSLAASMAKAIEHRGPDDADAWHDPAAGIALGHRRLSIVDLSPAGHQPMASHGGRYVIAFNGEIYNHAELREQLENAGAAPPWRGHSDTETLLAGFEKWGIEDTLAKTVGMFAIAVWDARERALFLARDRFGEKPLYYGWTAGAFVFGSELKALRAYPGFRGALCREALAQFLRFTYVPAPRSIYQGVYKLEPGCLLRITEKSVRQPPRQPLRPPASHEGLMLKRWWSLAAVVEGGEVSPLRNEPEALEALEARISEAVRLQSLADVPLGAFLSGGVDSSTIVALMQKQAMRPVNTFTVGLEDVGFDEAPYARAVARHLGTDHTELKVTSAEALAVVPQLPAMYDEPFADSSQIPTHLVCRAARQHVTVALSGDAGDELFGGYNRYFWGPTVWNRVAWMPYRLRAALSGAISAVPTRSWDSAGRVFNAWHHGSNGVQRLGDKAHKLATRLGQVRSTDDLYLSLVSEWQLPGSILAPESTGPVTEPASLLADPLPKGGLPREQLRMMYWDSITYLPDDILCKVDRAAMAISLETRVPFLDHRVAELAWRLPLSMKIRGTEGKWALRQVLYKYVPRELIERPKAGFGIPVGEWLRGPLREWAESLLAEDRIRREGYLQAAPIRKVWAEHLSGGRDWTHRIWSVLMFQAWLQAADL
jgi:asparagine synthase (glutamine-hydrolysing)